MVKRIPVPEVAFIQEGPGLRNWQWTERGMKVINGTNIRSDGRFDPSNSERFISNEEFEQKYKHFEIDPNDIVVASSGTLGKAARVKPQHLPMMMNTSVIRFRSLDRDKLNDEYLFAWLRSNDFLEQALSMATGAAQQNFGPSHVKLMTMPLPSISIQRRIASILSAYDDLIENNTRRIAILEEMARRIYEEWFVRFRFPGHEKVRMVESELGLVPEGWEIRSLGDIAAINIKSIRAGNAPREILYIDIASVTPGVIEQKQPYSFDAAPGRARRVVAHGDVIWSCVRPNRKSYALVLNPEPSLIASTGFAVLSAVEVPYSWLYFSVTTDAFVAYLTNHATGAAYPAVTAAVFESAPTLLPASSVLKEFHVIIEPMLLLCESLKRKNAILRTTRDLLLPKLISGELDVSHLPEPEAMAA